MAVATPDTDVEWLDLVVWLGKVKEAHKKETQVLNKGLSKSKNKGNTKNWEHNNKKNQTQKTCLPDG